MAELALCSPHQGGTGVAVRRRVRVGVAVFAMLAGFAAIALVVASDSPKASQLASTRELDSELDSLYGNAGGGSDTRSASMDSVSYAAELTAYEEGTEEGPPKRESWYDDNGDGHIAGNVRPREERQDEERHGEERGREERPGEHLAWVSDSKTDENGDGWAPIPHPGNEEMPLDSHDGMERWEPAKDGEPPMPLANTHADLELEEEDHASEKAAASALKVAAIDDSEVAEDQNMNTNDSEVPENPDVSENISPISPENEHERLAQGDSIEERGQTKPGLGEAMRPSSLRPRIDAEPGYWTTSWMGRS